MLSVRTQRYIKFARKEHATYWVVAAVVVEKTGDQIVVSEPRIVKIIPKQPQLALAGSKSKSRARSTAPLALVHGSLPVASVVGIRSPFFYKNNLYTQPAFGASLYARPPTL